MYCVLKRQTHFGQKMQEKTTLEKHNAFRIRPCRHAEHVRRCPAWKFKLNLKLRRTKRQTVRCDGRFVFVYIFIFRITGSKFEQTIQGTTIRYVHFIIKNVIATIGDLNFSGIQLRTNNTRNNQVCPFHNQKCHSYSSNTTTHSKQVNKLKFRQSAIFCHCHCAIKKRLKRYDNLTFKYCAFIIKSLVANFSLSFLHAALYSPCYQASGAGANIWRSGGRIKLKGVNKYLVCSLFGSSLLMPGTISFLN